MVKPAVLIVGNDASLRYRLQRRLEIAGCRVLLAEDGRQGIQAVIGLSPDIVISNLQLPDMDALDLCRLIRLQLQPDRVPVFLLTPEKTEADLADPQLDDLERSHGVANRVEYGCSALLAWLQATSGSPDQVVSSQGLVLDRRRHLAALNGQELKLTATEFRLLWTMASEPGKVFDRSELSRACTGGGKTRIRTIDVHVKSIRNKLGEQAELVETVHRLGYRFRAALPGRLPSRAADAGGESARRSHPQQSLT